ncbi:unnamed protein product, partial [Hapterophycus canaliculatus]
GGNGRLSGRDLLLALRDVGTTLTSAELAESTRVFQRQPDGCVSLPALLAGMHVDFRTKEGKATASNGNTAGINLRISYTGEGGDGVHATQAPAAASAAAVVGRAPFCAASETRKQQKGERSPTAILPTHQDEKGCWDASLSTPLLSESSTIARVLCAQGQNSGGGQDDILNTSPGRGRVVSTASTPQATVASSVELPQQDRRRCWVNENDEAGVSCGKEVDAAAKLQGDAIAHLAGIVFNPPSSLERLLHVLQVSKVSEQPTMSSVALGARLRQLRPGLGKTKAKQLAAVVCRYPEKQQVYLEQLHALLERRFGRRRADGSTPRRETVNAISRTLVHNNASSRDDCTIVRASSSMPATGATDSTVALPASLSSSCAAVGRVRRKLLISDHGLRGLRTALCSVGCRRNRGGGDDSRGDEQGSLNKDELRRALTIAVGTVSTPPTTKDVDDLFTLFSSQSSGGVRGGRVDARTVLRELRGELSPFRERIVRNVFHEIFAFGNNNMVTGTGITSSGREGTQNDRAGLGGWCSFVGRGPGGEGARSPSAACLAGYLHKSDAAGGEIPAQGVSVEQFLEYYRDVSAGIDGDDVFEAAVRASWPQQCPISQSDQGGSGSNGAPATATGEREHSRTAREGDPRASLSARQTRSTTFEALQSSNSSGGAGIHKQSAPPGGMGPRNKRNTAAVRVQALFRGHKGRVRAAGEDRKRVRRLAADRETKEEQRRPRAAACRRLGGRILRPKVASTYGF